MRVPSLLGTVKESFALMLNDAVLSEVISSVERASSQGGEQQEALGDMPERVTARV